MHVNAKKIAVTGLLLAVAIVLLVLSGVFEFNTLFLLAAAAFLVGIVKREYGIMFSFAFYLAVILLGFIIAPNKLYCFTFAAMGCYILIIEMIYNRIGKLHTRFQKRIYFWCIKYIVFNLIYIPVLILFPKLLFEGTFSKYFVFTAFFMGQIALFLYDKAYEYFQRVIWTKYRRHLGF